MKAIDISGKKFGRLLAIEFVDNIKGKHRWLFQCDCGKKVIAYKCNVMSGKTSSCRCLHNELMSKLFSHPKDITGQKFNHLTAISFHHKIKSGCHFWLFKCDCGRLKVISKYKVMDGSSKTCYTCTKHGMYYTRFYKIFHGMKARCNNPKSKRFNRYGGRGIKVEWQSFNEFINDMHESYKEHCNKFGVKNTSIDRIDNNGNYRKDNCRWATPKVQANNH